MSVYYFPAFAISHKGDIAVISPETAVVNSMSEIPVYYFHQGDRVVDMAFSHDSSTFYTVGEDEVRSLSLPDTGTTNGAIVENRWFARLPGDCVFGIKAFHTPAGPVVITCRYRGITYEDGKELVDDASLFDKVIVQVVEVINCQYSITYYTIHW